ncbi:MAG: hypothetical protein LBO09_02105 [Candidatus Peribacteria bacterium]|nr:hypothetical protein [Candidatus Peribacteria bacterium]
MNADLSPKKDNGNLEKLETSIDIKSLQEQTQQLQQEQIEKARQELPALAEQIKRSAMFNSSLEELGQVILAKNSVKKAEIIKRFKENPHLKDTLEQNIQKLTATPKESYDKSELLQIQLYGYLFLDEQVAIDGSKGPQTNLVLEALQERDSGKLEVITKKITKILQHYPKSLLRKSVIQNLVQKAKQQLQNPES